MVGRPRSDGRTDGVSLSEALVALALTLLLLGLLVPLLGRWKRAGVRMTRTVEALETERVVRDLVGLTVATGGVHPGGSGTMPAPGGAGPGTGARSVPVRNYVGTAVPCGGGLWRYEGVRMPDPARDSVAWLGASGQSGVVALVASAPATCPGPGVPGLPGTRAEGRALELEVTPGSGAGIPPIYALPSGPVLLRVFESGSYRLTDAFRYARSGTRAQPLTEVTLDPDSSQLTLRDRVLEVRFTSLDGHTRQRVWRVGEVR